MPTFNHQMMKLLITGATGYIGHNLLSAAIKKGHKVHALARTILPGGEHGKDIRFIQGDITDFDSVVDAMRGCDAVIHAAGFTRLWDRDRKLFFRINVVGTKNVLEAATYHNIQKLVFTSSCAVLGPSRHFPVTEETLRSTPFENDYETSKFRAEELVKTYAAKGMDAVIVSPSRVYGPGPWTQANPINRLIRGVLKRRWAFVPAERHIIGNYAFINDVVEGHFLALEKGQRGEKYILGGENISYGEFYGGIQMLAGQRIRYISLTKPVLKGGSALVQLWGSLTGRHTHISPRLVERLLQNRAVSSEKARRQLGFSITPFPDGLSETIRYLRSIDVFGR
jgi:nucleoside-diphosphate-sugar epimerase